MAVVAKLVNAPDCGSGISWVRVSPAAPILKNIVIRHKVSLFLCLLRAQVSGVIGIGDETLKAYEDGKRTLPFNVFYKLIQFLSIKVGILVVDD